MGPFDLKIELPSWVAEFLDRGPQVFETDEERMRFAIALARENAERRTGGPFGAAVFDGRGRLVAPGVNIVVTSNFSILHAEMVAISLAQKKLAEVEARIDSENFKHDANRDSLKYEQELVKLSQRGVSREQNLKKRKLGTDASLDLTAQAGGEDLGLVIDEEDTSLVDDRGSADAGTDSEPPEGT